MNRKRTLLCIILNSLIILSTVIAVGSFFWGYTDSLGSTGSGCFRYFTIDSNILAAVSSAMLLVFELRRLKDPSLMIPRKGMIFCFSATVAVSITFLTVVIFLAPMASLKGGFQAYLRFFERFAFPLHFSSPLLAVILLFLENGDPFRFRGSLFAMLPTVIYSVIYFIMVVAVKKWEDFYGFTFGGRIELAPASMAAMYFLTFLVILAEYYLILRKRWKR